MRQSRAYLGVIGSDGSGLCCGLGATSTKWIKVRKLFTRSWNLWGYGSWLQVLNFLFLLFMTANDFQKMGTATTELVKNVLFIKTWFCQESKDDINFRSPLNNGSLN